MSNSIAVKDGGPAFPVVFPERDDALLRAEGMSLRDYFAAQAARGAADALCDTMDPDYTRPEDTYDPVAQWEQARRHAELHARCAYMFADAMLNAREPQS